MMPAGIWSGPVSEARPAVYLTFDDGPHPVATPFALSLLAEFEATATFFCVGKNVVEHPALYGRILEEGHAVGNHTQHHLNGWKTNTVQYVEDAEHASRSIASRLFRPPYGKIKRKQAKLLKEAGYQLVFWSLLSGDFDEGISAARCLENVALKLRPGDIVVFHDSEKAWPRMEYALPRVLEHCKIKNWEVKALPDLKKDSKCL
jgi:peptidoglycan/xylan/chitin deacetylase (PgdA/CDA1 family)